MSFLKSLFGLKQPEKSGHDSAVPRFIHLLLLQAQRDEAAELVIGAASSSGNTPMRCKVRDIWHDLPPFPARIRRDVVAELARMAGLPAGRFPSKGVLDVRFGDIRLRWVVAMTSADGECTLKRVDGSRR